jgi:hypothetical protein
VKKFENQTKIHKDVAYEEDESAEEAEEIEESPQDEHTEHDETTAAQAQQTDIEPCMRMDDEPEDEIANNSLDEPTGMPSKSSASSEELRQDDSNSMLPIRESSLIGIEDDKHKKIDHQPNLQEYSSQSNNPPISFLRRRIHVSFSETGSERSNLMSGRKEMSLTGLEKVEDAIECG